MEEPPKHKSDICDFTSVSTSGLNIHIGRNYKPESLKLAINPNFTQDKPEELEEMRDEVKED